MQRSRGWPSVLALTLPPGPVLTSRLLIWSTLQPSSQAPQHSLHLSTCPHCALTPSHVVNTGQGQTAQCPSTLSIA